MIIDKKREEKKNYHIHIESNNKLLNVDLKELWRYRDLVWLFTKKNFILTYKQTILGPAWIFLNPFITSLIYMVVFGGIAGMSTDGTPQLLFYLGGNAVWSLFATCINKTANTFTANANVFGKVYFPRLTMPIANVLSALINFLVQMILFFAVWIYYLVIDGVHPNWEALPLLALVLLQLGALGLGCGIIVSSLTTKYRDLVMLVTFGVQLWMYATPVVYPISQIEEGSLIYNILLLNPVTPSIESFRYIFLGKGVVSVECWGISVFVTIILLMIGVLLFNKVEKTFMDTV